GRLSPEPACAGSYEYKRSRLTKKEHGRRLQGARGGFTWAGYSAALWRCRPTRPCETPTCNAGLPVPFGAKFAAVASRGPLECATDIITVRTEWEVRRAQCGVSGREHVRGRITVPQGAAFG